jgi:hypothetical protein
MTSLEWICEEYSVQQNFNQSEKVDLSLYTPWRHGGREMWLHSFSAYVLDGGKCSVSRPGPFNPRQATPDTRRRTLMGIGAVLDDLGSRQVCYPFRMKATINRISCILRIFPVDGSINRTKIKSTRFIKIRVVRVAVMTFKLFPSLFSHPVYHRWKLSIVRVRTHNTQLSARGTDELYSACWLPFVSVIQWTQVTTDRWKQSLYMATLCDSKAVDRQVNNKLPASPFSDL